MQQWRRRRRRQTHTQTLLTVPLSCSRESRQNVVLSRSLRLVPSPCAPFRSCIPYACPMQQPQPAARANSLSLSGENLQKRNHCNNTMHKCLRVRKTLGPAAVRAGGIERGLANERCGSHKRLTANSRLRPLLLACLPPFHVLLLLLLLLVPVCGGCRGSPDRNYIESFIGRGRPAARTSLPQDAAAALVCKRVCVCVCVSVAFGHSIRLFVVFRCPLWERCARLSAPRRLTQLFVRANELAAPPLRR